MLPSSVVEVAGHPRDMGLAQGAALRDAIREAVVRAGLPTHRSRWPSLRPLVSGALRGNGAGRELVRHFAHQAERLEGLARAADLPLDSVLALQLQPPGAVASRSVAQAGAGWIVRVSRPVVGFPSLELTRPWLVPAVAGVNAAGLVVAARYLERDLARSGNAPDASHGGARDGTKGGDTQREGAQHAPPLLLVQDCLARFENRAGAVDWCLKRPVEGRLVLWLVEASGASASVVVDGAARRVEPGIVDVEAVLGLVAGSANGAGAARGEASLFVDLAANAGSCVDRVGEARRAGASVLRLDPKGRWLRFEPAASEPGRVPEPIEQALDPHVE